MKLKLTKLNILSENQDLSARAKTGVSLHCHTEHSHEMLDFVPHYANKLPIISYFWNKEKKSYFEKHGKYPSFETGYWSPPLTSKMVFDIEKGQIEDAGLKALVSLTDHDCIDGNVLLSDATEDESVPISLEWTVPFDYGYFHVGVHNLPRQNAVELSQNLIGYTFDKERHSNENLTELFAMLNSMPHVLLILNHPLWDIELVGKERHDLLLKNFIRSHGKWIHALEINGFRSWSENKAVIELAEAINIPIATGGDRHGCKPNTVINLTDAATFQEFVEEIRVDKRAEVALMPEYEFPLHSRQLQSFSEILSQYPEFSDGRKRWFDRVFFDIDNGKGLVPLSEHGWKRGGPTWLRAAIWTLGFLGSPGVRPLFRILRNKADRLPANVENANFIIPDREEYAANVFSSETA